MTTVKQDMRYRRIRFYLWIFIIGLVLSGATAIPLETEVKFLVRLTTALDGLAPDDLLQWLTTVRNALIVINARYPFIAYGTDWLAFGHFIIALAFIGPLRDPVKNVWVIHWGMLACILVIPFTLAMGAVRGIPFGWRLIDCAFGVVGIIPLYLCRRQVQLLSQLEPVK